MEFGRVHTLLRAESHQFGGTPTCFPVCATRLRTCRHVFPQPIGGRNSRPDPARQLLGWQLPEVAPEGESQVEIAAAVELVKLLECEPSK